MASMYNSYESLVQSKTVGGISHPQLCASFKGTSVCGEELDDATEYRSAKLQHTTHKLEYT